jgi:Ca2+-binding EF-hand superfamily protein
MGSGNIKKTPFKKSELQEFHKISLFSHDIIISLHEHFSFLSSLIKDDGVIDYEEFCLLISREDNTLTKKIFKVIDTNHDAKINFKEFIKFISTFLSGSKDEQYSLSFKLFADEESKIITKELMFVLLKESLILEGNNIFLYIDDFCLQEIIINTFNLVKSDIITFKEYKFILDLNPYILNWFKIDINKIKVKVKSGCYK